MGIRDDWKAGKYKPDCGDDELAEDARSARVAEARDRFRRDLLAHAGLTLHPLANQVYDFALKLGEDGGHVERVIDVVEGVGRFVKAVCHLPIEKLTGVLAKMRGGTSVMMIEIAHKPNSSDIDAQTHATLDNVSMTEVKMLTAVKLALESSLEYHAGLLASRLLNATEGVKPATPAPDDPKRHGISHVIYNPLTIIEATKAALGVMQRAGERRVSSLAVAGLLVSMQADLAGESVDNTIEVMRTYMDNLKSNPKIPKVRA